MTSGDDGARRPAQRAERVALWRYRLIREAADPELSTRRGGGGWSGRWRTQSIRDRSVPRWSCPGPPWTGGSRHGGCVDSMRCCRRGARSPRAPRPRLRASQRRQRHQRRDALRATAAALCVLATPTVVAVGCVTARQPPDHTARPHGIQSSREPPARQYHEGADDVYQSMVSPLRTERPAGRVDAGSPRSVSLC